MGGRVVGNCLWRAQSGVERALSHSDSASLIHELRPVPESGTVGARRQGDMGYVRCGNCGAVPRGQSAQKKIVTK